MVFFKSHTIYGRGEMSPAHICTREFKNRVYVICCVDQMKRVSSPSEETVASWLREIQNPKTLVSRFRTVFAPTQHLYAASALFCLCFSHSRRDYVFQLIDTPLYTRLLEPSGSPLLRIKIMLFCSHHLTELSRTLILRPFLVGRPGASNMFY